MKFVCNTSPLIFLSKISRLDLLYRFYGDGIVPVSVMAELRSKPTEEVRQIEEMLQNRQFQIRDASPRVVNDLPAELGAGERQAIALALELDADLLVLDDQEGRRVARRRGITITGTIGVLAEARERGLIQSIKPELDRLIREGIWINKAFCERVLREFGE